MFVKHQQWHFLTSFLCCFVMVVLALPSKLVIGVPNKAVLEEEFGCVIYSLGAFDGCWFGQKEHFESFIIIW